MSVKLSLPDFRSPPLNEVVLGVQFSVPGGYKQILAHEVWSLFREQFPLVEERKALPPLFETFGSTETRGLQLSFMEGPLHDRYWFISQDKQHLLQFQNDRFHHNWRQVDGEGKYPRFKYMLSNFSEETKVLFDYFGNLAKEPVQITQAELTYINHIYYPVQRMKNPFRFLKFVNFNRPVPDDFNSTYRWVLRDSSGEPIGRLICEAKTAYNKKRGGLLILQLTARGAPKKPTISSALEFLKLGHEVIVTSFAELTSDSADRIWQRTQ